MKDNIPQEENLLSYLDEKPEETQEEDLLQYLPNNPQNQIPQLRANVLASTPIPPEAATKEYETFKQTKIPVDIVRAKGNEIKQMTELESINYDDLVNNFPKTAAQLADINKAAAIRDDIDNLSYFERIAGSVRQEYKTSSENVDLADLQIKQMLFDVTGNEKYKLSPIEENNLDLINQSQANRKDYKLGFISSIPSYTASAIPTILNTIPQTLAGAAAGAGTGFAVGGPAGATIGAGLGSKAGTAYGAGKLETGLAYQELKDLVDEKGKPIEKQVAAGGALATGVVNGLLELVPFEAATAPIKKAFSREGIKQLAKSSIGKEYLKNIGKLALAEGVTEGVQELSNIVFAESAKAISDGDFKRLGMKDANDAEGFMKFLSDSASRIAESSKAGFGGGIGLGVATGGIAAAEQAYTQRNTNKKDQGIISETIDKIKQSKIFQRSPELFKDTTQDTLGQENIYLPAEQVQTFFQTKTPEEQEEFFKAIPEAREQFQEALETGGNLVLPANSALAAIAKTESFAGLKDFMSFSPEGLNEKEAQDTFLNDTISNIGFDEQTKKQSIQDGKVRANIKNQILGLRLPKTESQDLITTLTSYYDTKSSRYGSEEAQKILDTYLGSLEVKSGLVAPRLKRQVQQDDFDIFLDKTRQKISKLQKPKKPLLTFLKSRGGVRMGSNLAGELNALGITHKTAPGLFRKEGGLGDVDNIPASEFQSAFPNLAADLEGGDYIGRQAMLDLLSREASGENLVKNPEEERMNRFLEDLDKIGIDLERATNEDIKKEIEHFQKEEQAESSPEPDIEDNQSQMSVEELEQPQPEFEPEVKPELISKEATIEDFGEKLQGAKKDLFKTYNKTISEKLPDDLKDVTLSKHFPEPDYEMMIANGVDVKILAAVKALRDIIPTKPQKSYKLKSWLDNFNAARSLANDLISGELDLDKFIGESKGYKGSEFIEKVKLYTELGYPAFKAAKDWTVRSGEYSVFNGVRYSPSKILFTAAKGRDFGTPYETYEEAINGLREKLSVKPDPEGRVTKLDIYQNTRTREIFIGKKVASGKYIDLRKGFTSIKEARAFLKENEQSLLELLAKKKESPETRKASNEKRVGKDYRLGENVLPEKFAAEFGFRGVQFGNYVEQAKRSSDLNNAYDALLDLSSILNVPSRALSLNGELGIAFGARGTGGKNAASAHYEPKNVVINLTKNKGAGSLGHEWWHALDNFFGKKIGKDFLTKNTRTKEESIRPEVVEAYRGVMEAISVSDLPGRSIVLDKRKSKDYWSTLEEMSARAFETYLITKAKEKGQSNDYLANVLDEKVSDVSNQMATDLGLEKEPYAYPTEKELPSINAAFDKLFETLKTEETDKGVTFYQNEQNPLGQTQFFGQKPIISLFKNKNRSTLLHELGHVFLQIESDIAKLPNISDQVKKDWKTLEEWLDIKDGKITTEAHEKFARGFEAYLREGKAPSIGLRNAFRRFKSWLTTIYKNVKALNVELSKPVREVFDRMLATDEAIDELKNNPIFRADEKILALLDEEEKAKYLALVRNTDEKTKEKLLAKSLKKLSREETKSYKEEKQKVKASIEAELKNTPVYRAFEVLRSEDGFKINAADIESYEGNFINKLPKDIIAEDGVAVDMAADFLGFADGGIMLNELANAPNFKSEVNRQTNEAMAMREESPQEKVVDESQNDAQAKKILYELNATNAKVKTFIDTKEAYKQKAKDIIGAKLVKDATNSYVFYLAEIKAAREAGVALGAKNYEKAVEWKKKQLLNHYLYHESLALKDEIEDLRKRTIRYNKKPVAGKVWIEEDYRERIVSLLEDFGLVENTIGHQKTNISELEAWKKEQAQEGVLGLVDFSEISTFQDKDNIRNLTTDEFRTLDDAIYNLAHVGQGLRTLELDGKRVEIETIVDDIVELVNKNIKKDVTSLEDPTKAEKLRRDFDSYASSLIKTSQTSLKIDGEQDLGKFYNYFERPVNFSELKKEEMKDEAYKKFDEIYKKHFGGYKITNKRTTFEQLGKSYSKSAVLSFALNWGNEINRRRVRDGFNYSNEHVITILSSLTKNELEFVQDVWDMVNSYWPQVESTQKKLFGFAPKKQRAIPFTLKSSDGHVVKMKGGYYPIAFSKEASLTSDTKEDLIEFFAGSAADKISFHASYTKERSEEKISKKIDLTLNPLTRHISQVITDISMKEAVWNSYKIINNKRLGTALIKKIGLADYKQLQTWLYDMYGRTLVQEGHLGKLASLSRNIATTYAMGFKVATALIQITGILNSTVKLGYKNMGNGLWKALGNGNPVSINQATKLAFAKSKILEDRSKTINRDIYEVMDKLQRSGKMTKAVAKFAFFATTKAQMLVDLPTWYGGYYKGLKDFNGDDQKAAELADRILIETQGSSYKQSRSAIERNEAAIVKAFTVFYSYMNVKLNLLAGSYRKNNFKKPKDVAAFASDFMMLFFADALVTEFLREGVSNLLAGRDSEDDDEENKALHYANLIGQSLASSIPGVSQFYSGLSGYSFNPGGFKGFEIFGKGIKNLGTEAIKATSEDEEADLLKALRGLNDSLSIFTVGGGSQIDIFLRAQQEAEKGEDVAPIDYILKPKK